MKTLPVVTLLAAFGAFFAFPLSFEIAASALFAAGFGAIAFADYARRPRLAQMAELAAIAAPRRSERFGLAA